MKEQATIDAGKLTCEQCRGLLSDYVDRELTESERAAVEHHLGNCTKCGTESARMLGLKKIVQHWGGVKGSGEFRKSLVNRMIEESQQMPVLHPGEVQATATAAVGPQADPDREGAGKSLPPIWILLAAFCLAVAVYFLVLWLRGL
ncbi:MAG: zf-HC2 domain-containing protein [Planctomycetota bacterium]